MAASSSFEAAKLESERWLLSPIATGDEAVVPGLYRDDPQVTRFVGWPPLEDADRARLFVEREARAWVAGDACRGWLVRERALRERSGAEAVLAAVEAVCDVEVLASARILDGAGVSTDRFLPRHGRHGDLPGERDGRRSLARLRAGAKP